MKNLTIFELTAEIEQIIDEIVDAEIAGDKDELDALHAELDKLYDARTTKHEGYVHVIKNTLHAAQGCKAEADFFAKRATALNNLAKRLKDTLKDDLIEHDEKSTTAGKYRIARQKNSQPTVHVRIPDEDLPAEYQNVTIEADKPALRQAIDSGEEIDGVDMEYGEHIRIRVG